ncbi:MAG TPA: DUF2752 domain-containing protein [Chitinophagaceae bacterium]
MKPRKLIPDDILTPGSQKSFRGYTHFRHSYYPEIAIWTVALIIPAFIVPGPETHFSFCLFKHLGLTWCPGCGLGESIALLYRGELAASLSVHPLGIFAVIILLNRIAVLLNKQILTKPNQHEQINECNPRP